MCSITVLVVDNYEKGEVKQLEHVLPEWFSQEALYMQVNAGSKIRNLMTFAMKKFKVMPFSVNLFSEELNLISAVFWIIKN